MVRGAAVFFMKKGDEKDKEKDKSLRKSKHITSTSSSGVQSPLDEAEDVTNEGDEAFASDIEDGDDESSAEDSFISVPNCMLGSPLIDFDNPQETPETPEKTFIVVANKFGKQVVFRFSKEKSLFIMATDNFIRRTNIYIFTHQLFEMGILMTIVTNCVFMALKSSGNISKISEFVFAAIYTFEMIVKIIAKGFILHEYSYLRNSWNWLDFIVVVLGYVMMAPNVSQLNGIRTFRVLRALKTISTVKGLKAMVNTLLKSMRMMSDVMILTVFFIAIFSLIGLQLFIGVLHNRCIKEGQNHTYINRSFHQDYFHFKDKTHIARFAHKQIICGNDSTAWPCPKGYQCVQNAGPNPIEDEGPYISYDSFHAAFLTTFQVVTLDYWETVFNSVISASGEWCLLYFLLVVFLGPFYLLNLVLAIVSASYEQEVHVDEGEEAEKQLLLERSASTYSFSGKKYATFLHGPETWKVDEHGDKKYIVKEDIKKERKKSIKEEKPDEEVEPKNHPRKAFYKLANTTCFNGLIITCIMVNTIIMAAEHYKMPELQIQIGKVTNYFFTSVFIAEMIIKMIAYKPAGYVNNGWNCFDGILVILSIVDLVVSLVATKGVDILKILKVFRLLRVLKLAQQWKVMGDLLKTIASSLGALGNVTVILALIIYIFSVVGMQMFGNSYKPEDYTPDDIIGNKTFPRFNFSDFGNSFMMIFRILCGKWIEPQWQLLDLKQYGSVIFILLVFIIGRWVVLNLFLALLLSSFGGVGVDEGEGDEEGDDEKEEAKEEVPKKNRMQRIMEWTKKKKKSKKLEEPFNTDGVNHPANDVRIDVKGADEEKTDIDIKKNNEVAVIVPEKENTSPPLSNGVGVTSNGDTKYPNANKEEYMHSVKISAIILQETERTNVDDCLCQPCYDWSFCVTSYLNSPIRRFWHNTRYQTNRFIENKYFEGTILFLIAFSSLTLVCEDVYLKEKPALKDFLAFCNYFFAIIFTLEFMVKLFAMGFVKYFTNFWNLLDVFIVGISLTTLLSNSKRLNALRSLRGLRPLRAISRFEGMKVVVNALVYSIPSIANVLLVCGVFWLIFSIMGFTLFGGTFWRCENELGEKIHRSLIKNKTECEMANKTLNYTWTNARIHFDDSIHGLLPLFQTATLEGWFEVMADAHDMKGKDLQPGYRENYAYQMFFVVFILLGSFFILNLFIGVIIDNFNRLKQKYEDGDIGLLLTPEQRRWITTLKAAGDKKPFKRVIRPESEWRGILFDFTSSKYFEFFIMSVIILNMMTMMIQSYEQSDEIQLALQYLNYVFTGIFTIEAVVRLIAMKLEYFKSGMNVFDFVIVLFSITVIIMKIFNAKFPISPGIFRVIRILRLGRLLRFIDSAKGIRKLLFTIIKSAPALRNIGTLLFLITFIYAIVGMNLFKDIKLQNYITHTTNFRTFLSSFCLLFRIATAAGWNGVLDSTRKDPSINDQMAIIYFCSYIILINLIIINMYIAVILENFNQAQSQEEAGISEDDLDAYYQTWQHFDKNASRFIKYNQLCDFVNSLEAPFKVNKTGFLNFLVEHAIPIKLYEGAEFCHCLDILKALIERSFGELESPDGVDPETLMKNIEEGYDKKFPQRKSNEKYKNIETTKERIRAQHSAAQKIQDVFRKHLLLEKIDLMADPRKMTDGARHENATAIKQLVTNVWKNKDTNDKLPSNELDSTEGTGEPEEGVANEEGDNSLIENI